jgi:hypothetical protein
VPFYQTVSWNLKRFSRPVELQPVEVEATRQPRHDGARHLEAFRSEYPARPSPGMRQAVCFSYPQEGGL